MGASSITVLINTKRTAASDECYTPKEAIIPLLKYLKKDNIYYDCTSNISSNIINTFKDNKMNCVSSDGRDFLIDSLPEGIHTIVTNPPYSKKDKFIKRCYDFNKPFALLLPVTALQGQARGNLFRKKRN